MTEQPTVELTNSERLSGPRLRKCIEDIRAPQPHKTRSSSSPLMRALAIADLIELLAGHAGIELAEPVRP